MKILIVPDVHGRKFWRKALELIETVDRVIFLGDYLDPYPKEGITFDDALIEFNNILEFKNKYPHKVILLLGNHCLHYVIKEFMNCSRLNIDMRDTVHRLFNDNIDKFQLIYELDNYLFSHAGIYEDWMGDLVLDDLKNYKTFLKDNWRKLEDLSYLRGGYNNVGSCIWADIRESLTNDLYSDKIQIVGHTQLESQPYLTSTIKCLDVRKCFILDTKTDEVKSCI
jgi:Icc-related predicted phosphoesterase